MRNYPLHRLEHLFNQHGVRKDYIDYHMLAARAMVGWVPDLLDRSPVVHPPKHNPIWVNQTFLEMYALLFGSKPAMCSCITEEEYRMDQPIYDAILHACREAGLFVFLDKPQETDWEPPQNLLRDLIVAPKGRHAELLLADTYDFYAALQDDKYYTRNYMFGGLVGYPLVLVEHWCAFMLLRPFGEDDDSHYYCGDNRFKFEVPDSFIRPAGWVAAKNTLNGLGMV